MIIVITGPTCTGKSETAFKLAKLLDATIINGDAFQIYKELNIGVAKPEKSYIEQIPHKLYSFVSVNHEYSIAEYQKDLRQEIDKSLNENKNVIIVGGSGLYIRSALYDYEFTAETSVDMSKFNSMTNIELHRELEKVDLDEACKIHENNRKRVLRALEIYYSQGKTKTEIIASQKHKLLYDAKFFARDMSREELYKLIGNRVDKMIEEGLINEAKNLFDEYGESCKAFQAIGYKEIIPYLNKEISLEETIELIKKNTRNYVKRQMTFIRHQFPINFYKDTNDLLRMFKDGQF